MCITLDGGSSPSVLPIDYFFIFFMFSLSARENRESFVRKIFIIIYSIVVIILVYG